MKSDFYDMDDPVEGISSKFNEAAFQMWRIHWLQQKINMADINPTAYNLEEGSYQYEIILSCINSQFREVSSKLKEAEMIKGKIMRMNIQSFLESTPIHEGKPNGLTKESEEKVSKVNWYKFRDLLYEYGLFVRELLEKHEMTSPKKDELVGL